jgi:hypothetical protein
MTADVVQTMNGAILASNENQRVRIDCQRDKVASVGDLTGMGGKKPATPPNALEVRAIHRDVRIKAAGQGPAGPMLSC